MLTRLAFMSATALVGFALLAPNKALANPQMMQAAKAAICGPEIKKLKVNGHEFTVKKATINRWAGKTTFVAGQLSHHLRFRADDQIFYTIAYDGMGMPKAPEVRIDRGGVASWFSVLSNSVILFGATKVKIGPIMFELKPEKLPEIATQISKLVEGAGWEAQAAAVINFVSFAATDQMSAICRM